MSDELLRAVHDAADKLDDWHDYGSTLALGGLSPGGVVRDAAHDALGVDVDGCPICTPICPTICDADCEARCHESHVPPVKRQHDVEQCPGFARR